MTKLAISKKLSNVQTRDLGDGKLHIHGIIPYNSTSEDLGGYREVILPSAFTKSLNDGGEIYALLNHDCDEVIGTTENGSLVLTSTDAGLEIDCALPDTSYARDAYNLIRDGYVNGISFGFVTVQHRFDMADPANPIDYLIEVRLLEVSFLVAFPAYSAADTAEARNIDLDRISEIVNKRTKTEQDLVLLRSLLKSLDKIANPQQLTEAAESTEADTAKALASLLKRL